MKNMEDFYWNFQVNKTSFTFVMNECNDNSAWVGDIFKDDGGLTDFDAVIDAVVMDNEYPLLYTTELAEKYLNALLEKVLQDKRGVNQTKHWRSAANALYSAFWRCEADQDEQTPEGASAACERRESSCGYSSYFYFQESLFLR